MDTIEFYMTHFSDIATYRPVGGTCHIDCKALLRQALLDVCRGLLLVFDNKEFHEFTAILAGARGRLIRLFDDSAIGPQHQAFLAGVLQTQFVFDRVTVRDLFRGRDHCVGRFLLNGICDRHSQL